MKFWLNKINSQLQPQFNFKKNPKNILGTKKSLCKPSQDCYLTLKVHFRSNKEIGGAETLFSKASKLIEHNRKCVSCIDHYFLERIPEASSINEFPWASRLDMCNHSPKKYSISTFISKCFAFFYNTRLGFSYIYHVF